MPVAELEQLTEGDISETLQAFWSGDAIAYYQNKPIYENMILASAWRVISKPSLKGVLDTIRTRVLEFVLNVEDDLKINSPEKSKKSDEESSLSEKVTQNVSNIIYGGNVSVGNFGNTTQQTITVKPGNFDDLKKELKGLGVTENLLGELELALKNDENSNEQPGPNTTSWIAKTMILIGRGALSVSSNAAGSLISTAIMQFLGIKMT